MNIKVVSFTSCALLFFTQAAAQPAHDAHSTHSCLAEITGVDSTDNRAQVWIESAEFIMGDSSAYPEEGPAHKVSVAGFWIDTHEVTNGQFARFVEENKSVCVCVCVCIICVCACVCVCVSCIVLVAIKSAFY